MTCTRYWRPAPRANRSEDALAVCFAFKVTDRLAYAFGFLVLGPQGMAAGAKNLLARGYR
jgi:hypothetical protein